MRKSTIHALTGLFFVLLFCIPHQRAQAQGELRVMFYNVLNFPNPVPEGRWDTLQHILSFSPVDLLLVCELKNEAGADSILNQSLNVNGSDLYERADYVPMMSAPGNPFKLQQTIFWNRRKMGLASSTVLTTQVRDINVYTMYLKTEDLATTNDTVFFDVFVNHLKSSQGAQNEAQREGMVAVWQNYMASLPADRNVIYSGDLNIYSSNEPAYQRLLSDTNSSVLIDPINVPGNWHNNSAFSGVHTQSTRTSQIFGDGAGGGMDDRFDFILLSESIIQGTKGLTYQFGTYEALGNDGTCFNQNLTNCNSPNVPANIRQSLRFMSDHLPVILKLTTPTLVSTPQLESIHPTLEFTAGNVIQNDLNLRLTANNQANTNLIITNPLGQEVYREAIKLQVGQNNFRIQTSSLGNGLYFIQLSGNGVGLEQAPKFIIAK